VAALQCISLAPVSLGLHDRLVRARAKARGAVSGVYVGHDVRIGGDLGGREDLQRARIIVSGREAKPAELRPARCCVFAESYPWALPSP
jgi:hypothetical protein